MERNQATWLPLVDLSIQHRTLRGELQLVFDRMLDRCDFILGSGTGTFEQQFADFIGNDLAIGVGSGLDAIRLALAALDIGVGDEVILPANTYIATALAVSATGASPVFVDCEASTYTISPELIRQAITPATRAIIPVHLTGQSVDMDPILATASQHGLAIVEDAAQAHGTKYKGRRCGSLGTIGCFSFYPGKNLGACGDGGMLTLDNVDNAEKLRQLRDYGRRSKHEHALKGINSRLDSLQAAILSVKLPYLDNWNYLRHLHAQQYRYQLDNVGDLTFQREADYSTHIYHLFVVETNKRDVLRRYLSSVGIETGIHYPTPIHLQPAYAELGYKCGAFPHAERLANTMLSLPVFPELTALQIERVVEEIKRFYGNKGLWE